jgi:hypothetical protein
MQVLERTKDEVQKKAEKMSDFLRMEYLENCTRKFIDPEILRYCFAELSRLYERNVMYPDAIKYLIKYEEVSLTSKDKLAAYLKEIELIIKGGFYDRVDFAKNRAKDIAKGTDMYEIERKIIDMYKQEAAKFDKANKYSPALKAYEQLLHLLKGEEQKEVKRKLVYLYNRLGRVRESIEMEKELQR